MLLALGLIHNKTPAANRNQINALAAVAVRHVLDTNGQEFDPSVQDDVAISRVYYTIAGLSTQHEVTFFQVLPTGVNQPNNFYALDVVNVQYSPVDNADKTGSHPRFWNWLIKRPVDYGADICAIVTDHLQFTVAGLQIQINRLVDRRMLVRPLWGIACSSRLLREVFPDLVRDRQPLLREDLSFSDALDDLRARIAARDWESD